MHKKFQKMDIIKKFMKPKELKYDLRVTVPLTKDTFELKTIVPKEKK